MRFSRRLDWEEAVNELSRVVETQREAGAALLDLTISNPTFVDLPYPVEILRAALVHPDVVRYRPEPAGLQTARISIAAYYEQRGQRVLPDDLILTASTSEAYGYLFKLLADPGDELLAPRPSYPLFDLLARLEGLHLTFYSLAYDGAWHIDFASLESAIQPTTRAILLVHPNNPTGSFLKHAEWTRLVAIAKAHRLALIVDEVFSDYGWSTDSERVASTVDEIDALTFSLSGLSKVAGLPQFKLGWIHIGGPREQRTNVRERLELITDSYLSVSTPVQLGAALLLDVRRTVGRAIRERVATGYETIQRATRDTPCDLLHCEGGWYATLRLPRVQSDEQWAIEFCTEEGVLVQPGYFFDFNDDAHVVISLLTPPRDLEEGIGRIIRHVNAHR